MKQTYKCIAKLEHLPSLVNPIVGMWVYLPDKDRQELGLLVGDEVRVTVEKLTKRERSQRSS